jgi:3-dehydroquinate synthase
MPPVRIEVQTSRAPYQVLIGRGLMTSLSELLRDNGLSGEALVVSCPPVWKRHGKAMKDLAGRAGPTVIPDGERAKNLATVSKIYDAMIRRRLDRSATLVAFGGGVVGDVAGFAAATYLRGIALVQVPTTLLSQVDSAVGGKVGVNLPAGKNLIGSFHAPSLVVCDPDVLRTLPTREFRAGLYEVVKYGVIASRPLFERVSARLPDILKQDGTVLTDLIADCCRIKARVVELDERESGPRRVLNFGHTVGHALEAITKYRRFRHGEAIGWGMLAAARISAARGLFSTDDEAKLQELIRRMGALPVVKDLSARRALEVISHDKKVVGGKLHFVLAREIGATAMASDVEPAEIAAAMRSLGMKA